MNECSPSTTETLSIETRWYSEKDDSSCSVTKHSGLIPEILKAPRSKNSKVFSTLGGHANLRLEMIATVCTCMKMMMTVVSHLKTSAPFTLKRTMPYAARKITTKARTIAPMMYVIVMSEQYVHLFGSSIDGL